MKRQRVGGGEKIRGEFFGYMPVGDVSMRQRVLRPVKKLAVMLGVMPKTTGGKKWLKRIVFGGLVEMPAEIGPQITQITRINGRPSEMRFAVVNELHRAGKKAPQYDLPDLRGKQKAQKCPQSKQNGKDEGTLYRTCYVEPDRISSDEANTGHKVIYCVASLS